MVSLFSPSSIACCNSVYFFPVLSFCNHSTDFTFSKKHSPSTSFISVLSSISVILPYNACFVYLSIPPYQYTFPCELDKAPSSPPIINCSFSGCPFFSPKIIVPVLAL